MATPQPNAALLTPAEYLEGERHASVRHEFVAGRVFAMAGASERHNVSRLNVAGLLNASTSEACRVFGGDMKLQVEPGDGVRFFYPDVFVSCGPADPHTHVRRDEVLVIEVLSPTTKRTDRYEKFHAYTSLPSLSETVQIEQDAPLVEIYRRRTNWQREAFGPGATVNFESIGQSLTLDQIYRRAGL